MAAWRPLLTLACAAGLLELTGCLLPDGTGDASSSARASGQAAAVEVPDYSSRRTLPGGDALSWPTPAGNAADSNYCDVALRLPLSREPVWEFTYTAMQFSMGDPIQLAHHDGLLAVISISPQILALDVDTGRQIFNRDVYEHLNVDSPENFSGLFFNPVGLLAARDNVGRHYCWDVSGGVPRRLWLGPQTAGIGGYVALEDKLITSLEGEIRSLNIVTGEQQWSYPKMGQRSGVVVSAAGIVVAWSSSERSSSGEFYALDGTSGVPLWSYISGVAGWRGGVWAVIDDRQRCVYLALADERLQRRDLETGVLEWEYSWLDLTSTEEREAMFGASRYGPFPLYAVAPIVTPAGIVICLINGAVVALDHAGERRWTYRTDVATWGSIGFRNAVVVVEIFVAPANRQEFSPLQAFCPDAVDWDSYRSASEHDQRSGLFERYCVLNSATGEVLEYFETEVPTAAAAPAHNLFIVGETAKNMTREHRILAYDWLDWQPEEPNTTERGEDD